MKTIVQDGHPVLRDIAQEVPPELFGTDELSQIVRDMSDALDSEKDGVAIAAPQIGVSMRIFVVRYDRLHPAPPDSPLLPDVGVYINPELTRASRKRDVMDEGCLSVRGIYGKTYRTIRATVRAKREDGSMFERGGGGILAQVFQHELDHLDGILFIDHAIDLYDAKQNAIVVPRESIQEEDSQLHHA